MKRFARTALTGQNVLASPCSAWGPCASGPGRRPRDQLGRVFGAGPRWGFSVAASFPRTGAVAGASALFAWLWPVQSSGGHGWRVKSWRGRLLGRVGGIAHLVLEQLTSGLKARVFEDIFFLRLHVSKQLNYTWIIFPTFCSQL